MDSVIPTTPLTSLPERIATWIRSGGGPHALLLITIDGYVRPHAMMLARDGVFVISATHVRVAMSEKSQSAENLSLRSSATLAIYDADLACVVKTHAMGGARPLLPGIVAYDLGVEEVRLDTPTTAEASARLVTGLRFEGRAERVDIQDRLKNLEPR